MFASAQPLVRRQEYEIVQRYSDQALRRALSRLQDILEAFGVDTWKVIQVRLFRPQGTTCIITRQVFTVGKNKTVGTGKPLLVAHAGSQHA